MIISIRTEIIRLAKMAESKALTDFLISLILLDEKI
tara:strand:- start:1102 stop:1209 length:108 start_codon:yes stop_codon:yes gene_type:complete